MNDPSNAQAGQPRRWTRKQHSNGEPLTENLQPIVGVAWYRKDQWEELLRLSEDRASLEDSFGEWLIDARLTLLRLRREGLDVRQVEVDVNDLASWCKEEGVHITASSRAGYVAYKLGRESDPGAQ
ncbi:MAG: hypothetical protein Q7R39_10665 [Dehalococcoidia bacterium]|nr:hypothetical protein [Dehalococcoidia bacterium]